MVRLNVELSDEMHDLVKACKDDSEYSDQSKYIRALIREDAEQRGLTAADAPSVGDDEEPPLVDRYDPETWGEGTLSKEQLKELSVEVEEINPEHVERNGYPNGHVIELVTAITRYQHDAVDRGDVEEICREIGADTDYYLRSREGDKDVPGEVVQRLGGDGKTEEIVDKTATSSDPMETFSNAAAVAILGIEIGPDEEVDVERYVSTARSHLKDVEEEITGTDDLSTTQSVNVVNSALYELESEVLFWSNYTQEKLEDVDWPRTAEGLVEWYIDEEEPGWANNEDMRREVLEDIERALERVGGDEITDSGDSDESVEPSDDTDKMDELDRIHEAQQAAAEKDGE